MLKHPRYCIVIGETYISISHEDRRGSERDFRLVPLPQHAFGDPHAMASCLQPSFPKITRNARVVLIIQTGLASLRTAAVSGPDTGLAAQECMRQAFPFGDSFNEGTHVFSYAVFPEQDKSILLLAALPAPVADSLLNMCFNLGFSLRQIKRIDTAEHLWVRFYKNQKDDLWLILPYERGTRVLSLSGGLPRDVYFIGNDPACRETELVRIWYVQPFRPACAVILSNEPEHAWILTFLAAHGVGTETVSVDEGYRNLAGSVLDE